jgi:two-component system sensor histidine kinase CpxA
MRPGRLYIKIFLSFLAVLIVTEALIFGLFLTAVGQPLKERVGAFAAAKAARLQGVVEERLAAGASGHDPALADFLVDFARILEARIWMTRANGDLLLKTFPEALPAEAARIRRAQGRTVQHGDIRIHTGHRAGFYVTLPVNLPQAPPGTLHIFSPEHGPPHPGGGFGVGLLLIGGVIALLVVPVSRLITKRIKTLQVSAAHIAEGDLSHRAEVGGKDEIGELGRAFNTMAARLERMIQGTRELTANVSHELRSPLARMRVALELLRDRMEAGDPEGVRPPLDHIQEEIELLDDLIGRILELSRLESRPQPFENGPVDLEVLISKLVERFRPAFQEKGLDVFTRLEPVPEITADPDALNTAVSNLLDNLLKHTPEGGRGRVELSASPGQLILTVANSCPDPPEEDVEVLFEPFRRARSAQAPGSGLGLAITRRVFERHGGSVKALRRDGELAFVARLPRSSGTGEARN